MFMQNTILFHAVRPHALLDCFAKWVHVTAHAISSALATLGVWHVYVSVGIDERKR